MSTLGILIIITILGKLFIHLYLDYTRKNNMNLKSLLMGGDILELFFWYMETVDSKYIFLKKICNLLYVISILLLIIGVIHG